MRWLFVLVLSGCASHGVLVKNTTQSVAEIRSAIIKIAGEPIKVSADGREITSQYFSPKPDPQFNPNTSPHRMSATFYILGERRPFNIRVEVSLEKKVGQSYNRVGEDITMSKRVAKDLADQLNQGREGRSFIDDFRAF